MTEAHARYLIGALLSMANANDLLPVALRQAKENYAWRPEDGEPARYHSFDSSTGNEVTFIGQDGREEKFRIVIQKM